MCGIAGVFAYNADLGPAHQLVVAKLNSWQQHRGPDGEGLWSSLDRAVIFGHRRLAIIDTGSSGAQPMQDATGRWVITFNGQIYNYQALREELEQLGVQFQSSSDTEVLIAVVAQWGEAGLRRLRGMFAFALYDNVEKEVWLARDPYGIKPLYVAYQNNRVWFASQARALADCAPIETQRDAAALTSFYLWGHVVEPFSWWKGAQMFPPGHVQRIRCGKALLEPQSFYSVPQTYVARPPHEIARNELRNTLMDAVGHHLVADVPVGIFLSAGIDSKVIATLATAIGAKLRTITLAFADYKGTPNDEAPMAEALAKALGSDHATVWIDRDDFEGAVDHIFASMDQPSMDGVNTYFVSRAAASHRLKVALSGLGGDELFGGYPSFRQVPMIAAMGRILPAPRRIGGALQTILRRILPRSMSPKFGGLFKYSENIGSAYFLRRAVYLAEELDELLDESWLEEGLSKLEIAKTITRSIEPIRGARGSGYAQTSALESCWYMRNQLLRDADWAGMAHGVEIRVPYVDTTVLDYLGPAIASKSPPTKADLAACVTNSQSTHYGTRKTGFTTPVRDWIGKKNGSGARGLRGWNDLVHKEFRVNGSLPAPFAAPWP